MEAPGQLPSLPSPKSGAVAGNLLAYVGRGYPRQCIQAGYCGSL